MLLLKYMLTSIAWGLFAGAAGIALNNLYKVVQYHRQMRIHIATDNPPQKPQLRWTTAKWAFLGAWLPLILAKGIAVVPSGMGGIRVSQTSGTRPGTLYPGVHWITPMVESAALYHLRDRVLVTSSGKGGLESIGESDKSKKPADFAVQSKEGLSIGLAITVRYQVSAGNPNGTPPPPGRARFGGKSSL